MKTLHRILGSIVLAGALLSLTTVDAEANVFNCQSGSCPHWAACEGDFAWTPPCEVQCMEYLPPPDSGFILVGSAKCDNIIQD